MADPGKQGQVIHGVAVKPGHLEVLQPKVFQRKPLGHSGHLALSKAWQSLVSASELTLGIGLHLCGNELINTKGLGDGSGNKIVGGRDDRAKASSS